MNRVKINKKKVILVMTKALKKKLLKRIKQIKSKLLIKLMVKFNK